MAGKSQQNINRMSWRLAQKSQGRRAREEEEGRPGKRCQKDQFASDRGNKPISFFVVRSSACILLCEFKWFWIRLRILPYSLSDLFVLQE